MKEASGLLLAECEALARRADEFSEQQWSAPTPFHGWTPWDQVAHLCLFDQAGLLAVTDESAFARLAADYRERRAHGREVSGIARDELGKMNGPVLLAHWRHTCRELAVALSKLQPATRLPWFGPDMSARSFATARMMETWAHGQDVYDGFGIERAPSDGLRSISHLGVTTFGWSFRNRGLVVPPHVPHVVLTGPESEQWEWHTSSDEHYVRGTAEDFCLVVTQRRHVSDTGLDYAGSGSAWMAIAQCFAGKPADGPPPGARVRRT